MGEWQPIESAPRDGSSFLAYNPLVGSYSTAFTVRWSGDPGEFAAWQGGEPEAYQGFPCGFWMNGLGGYPFGKWDCQPTHWMPLPDPPRKFADPLEAALRGEPGAEIEYIRSLMDRDD